MITLQCTWFTDDVWLLYDGLQRGYVDLKRMFIFKVYMQYMKQHISTITISTILSVNILYCILTDNVYCNTFVKVYEVALEPSLMIFQTFKWNDLNHAVGIGILNLSFVQKKKKTCLWDS